MIAPHTDTTPGGLQLPHPDNTLEVDVLRLRAAIGQMDTALAGLAQQIAAGATQAELDAAVAALGARIDAASAAVDYLAANKVGVVNGQAGPAVTLAPAHLGLGPANGPSAVVLARDGQGRLATVTQTIAGKNAVHTLTYDGNGRLATVATAYDGRTRTQTLNYDGAGVLLSIAAVEGNA